MTKEQYHVLHQRMLEKMRRQLSLRNSKGIQITGKRLHRFRRRYRKKFMAA